MPIIPRIGRRSLKMRLLIILVYTVLIAGSVTTVYPFLMMLGSSVASITDFYEYRVMPRYLFDDKALMVRYLADKHRQEFFDLMKYKYRIEEPVEVQVEEGVIYRRYGRVAELEGLLQDYDVESAQFKVRVSDWLEFVDQLPLKYKDTYFHYPGGVYLGEVEVGFQEFLKEKYPDIKDLQVAHTTVADQYIQIDPPYEAHRRHSWFPVDDQKMRDWIEYCRTLSPRMFDVVMIRQLYQAFLEGRYPEVAELNAAWAAEYEYHWQIPFARTRPRGREGEDWEEYVRKNVPLRHVRIDLAAARPAYVEFIRERFGDVKSYNGIVGDDAASFEEARLNEYAPGDSRGFQTWQDFYEKAAPIESIVVESADRLYEDFLRGKYRTAATLDEAYGTDFETFAAAEVPWREVDYWDMTTRKSQIRWSLLTRNYVYVIKSIFLQGRPILNTLILVTLTVGAAVTINPLAAYALSRYRLTYGPKVLIFMLATMSFPAQVAMIPNFLMIKQLGLLNTFAALVLPGLANGYSVFLLKGFFDSLPQELYEAASIDGASEFRMFRTITMPLSLPILSVIALYAFSGAYGSFIWAFTVCQDKSMWTLMVFLQQFQVNMPSHPYLVMASLVLAAVPTLVVFLSAQKVLMKGIVVPTMK